MLLKSVTIVIKKKITWGKIAVFSLFLDTSMWIKLNYPFIECAKTYMRVILFDLYLSDAFSERQGRRATQTVERGIRS